MGQIDQLIESNNPDDRLQAIRLINQSDNQTNLPHLIRLLNDESVAEYARSAITLQGGRLAVSLVVPLLKDPALSSTAFGILQVIGADGLSIIHNACHDPQIRLNCINLLGSIASMESLNPLIESLSDPDPEIRRAGALALGRLGNNGAFGALCALLSDEPRVQQAAIEALGSLNHPDLTEHLISQLPQCDARTTCSIAATLGRQGDPAAIGPLLDKAAQLDSYSAISIARAILPIIAQDQPISETQAGILRSILNEHLKDEEHPQMMLEILGRIGDEQSSRSIAALARNISIDDDLELWQTALASLIKLDNTATIEAMLDGHENQQIMGAAALAALGRGTHEIERHLDAAPIGTKRVLAGALESQDRADNLNCFRRLLHDTDGHVMVHALRALGRLGDDSDLETIKKLIQHPYPDVSATALEAMQNLDSQATHAIFHELFRSSNAREQLAGLQGLSNTQELPELIRQNYSNWPPAVQLSALKISIEHKLSLPEELIEESLQSPDNNIRYQALKLIGAQRSTSLRGQLEKALETEDMWQSYHAIQALGKFHDQRACNILLNILEQSADFLKIVAIKTLGTWQTPALAEELELYLDDDNPDISQTAAAAIEKLRETVINEREHS